MDCVTFHQSIVQRNRNRYGRIEEAGSPTTEIKKTVKIQKRKKTLSSEAVHK